MPSRSPRMRDFALAENANWVTFTSAPAGASVGFGQADPRHLRPGEDDVGDGAVIDPTVASGEVLGHDSALDHRLVGQHPAPDGVADRPHAGQTRRQWSSTAMKRPLRLSPHSSRPRLSVLGQRPVATRTRSASTAWEPSGPGSDAETIASGLDHFDIDPDSNVDSPAPEK